VRLPAVPALLVAVTCAVVAAVPAPARADDQHADEVKVGAGVYADFKAKGLLVADSPYAAILQRVGGRIASVAGLHGFRERFYIVIGNQMNAFSAPDGRVYVNEGLLRQVDNEAELANVLAHESAHLVLGHVAAQMRVQKRRGLFERVKGVIEQHSDVAGRALDAANLVANYAFLNFTRQQEYEADHRGVQIAANAGYDPWGTVWFLHAVYRLDGDSGYESYVQHHPSVTERIAKIEAYFKSDPSFFRRWSSTPPPGSGLPVGWLRALGAESAA
jgi:predicted Zn-dependent protease